MLKIFLKAAVLLTLNFQTATAQDWYRGYNHAYFSDELPEVVITNDLKDDRLMAITDQVGSSFSIRFNPKFNISMKQRNVNLLHEQCHISLVIEKQFELDDHGIKWQACMHRLANEGAFENLW